MEQGLLTSKWRASARRIASCELLILVVFQVIWIARQWVVPINSSLGLDETGTVWAISGGFSNIAHRATVFPQSVLYCVILWISTSIGGLNEVALRVPSLLATLASTVLLYRLGARLFNRHAALVSTMVFVCMDRVSFAAVDAHPYALGILAVIWSTSRLLDWVNSPSRVNLALYVIAASLPLYFVYFFGCVLAAQGVYVTYLILAKRRTILCHALSAAFLTTLATAPLWKQFLAIYGSRALHSVYGSPSWNDLTMKLAPPSLMVPFFAALFAACFAGGDRFCLRLSIDRHIMMLLISMVVIPPVSLFAVSTETSVKVWIPRYMMSAAPAMALLVGKVVGSLDAAWVRICFAFFLLLLSLVSLAPRLHLWFPHSGDDWRGAFAQVRSFRRQHDLPVFVTVPFVEVDRVKLPAGSDDDGWLLAPLNIYPAGGPVAPMPMRIGELNCEFVEAKVADLQRRGASFLFVTTPFTPLVSWMRRRLGPGYKVTNLIKTGSPAVLLFERSIATGESIAGDGACSQERGF